ncbi:hypothetical protein ACQ858_13350 [Variovorax ureilyticus]|uniref:hypothetical protein n=1 Tax=Variovorax ureilyticus TaxID=1836198 RepID=UPI003D668E24
MTRRILRMVGSALIGTLLFAQMAIAAYACPGLVAGSATELQMISSTVPASNAALLQSDQQATPCADMDMAGAMDSSSANLCAEHCRHNQQSDHVPTLTVPVVLLTTLFITPYATDVATPPRPAATVLGALASVDPPHAILHCCLRT